MKTTKEQRVRLRFALQTGTVDGLSIEESHDLLDDVDELIAALKSAKRAFAKIADGCSFGDCCPETPCTHCIALQWIDNHGGLLPERE